MSMKEFFVYGFVMMMGISSFGQANILNADKPEDIGKLSEAQALVEKEDKPLEYGYVGDRDILWSKGVWEIIDLDERVNFPLYYPIDTNNIGSSRRSLYDVLVSAIKQGKIENVYVYS